MALIEQLNPGPVRVVVPEVDERAAALAAAAAHQAAVSGAATVVTAPRLTGNRRRS